MVVRNVPVEVCGTCCDVYLDDIVVRRLDDLVDRLLAVAADIVFGRYVVT
jgi:hypothetical protein